MSTFTTLYKALTVKSENHSVEIFKVRKDGTKREFFRATYQGKPIGKTLWARRYDAQSVAKNYIKRLEKKAA